MTIAFVYPKGIVLLIGATKRNSIIIPIAAIGKTQIEIKRNPINFIFFGSLIGSFRAFLGDDGFLMRFVGLIYYFS